MQPSKAMAELKATGTSESRIICAHHDKAIEQIKSWKGHEDTLMRTDALIHWRAIRHKMCQIARELLDSIFE